MFNISIETDNSAFTCPECSETDFYARAEVARILRNTANLLEQDGHSEGQARDINGNTVGAWEFEL